MTDFLGDKRYEDIMIHVLGTYIISYCEYRGKIISYLMPGFVIT